MTVVIPTLNEAGAIGSLICEVQAAGYEKILVVDGYSQDGTQEIAADLGALVVGQHGAGKAGAVLTARDLVTTPFFVLMDGDGSYDPADIDRLVAFSGRYDEVIGARPIGTTSNMTGLHKIGNRVLSWTFNLLMGSQIPDVASGMYLLRTRKVREMIFDRSGFEIDQEIAAQVLVSGKLTTVPIRYRERVGEPKSTTWRQGFRALIAVVGVARRYNAPVLFGLLAGTALVPASILLGYGLEILLTGGSFHSGLLLAGLVFLAIGGQGLAIATTSYMIRRLERRLRGQL